MFSIDAMMKHAYDMPFEYKALGKPSKETFEFAEDALREQAAERGIEITNFYMIGDNPAGDIVGAN